MIRRLFWGGVAVFAMSFTSFAGPDQGRVSIYFDTLVRQPAEGFENWYPKTKNAIPNPHSMVFDAARAVGAPTWKATAATAAVATYVTSRPYTNFVSVFSSPEKLLGWLRKRDVISESLMVENKENPKIRFSMVFPFLDPVNGYFEFRSVPVSDQRTVLRIKQVNEEGPSSDMEIMILADRAHDLSTQLHAVMVINLKPTYKNGFIANIWFKYRTRKILESLLEALVEEAAPEAGS